MTWLDVVSYIGGLMFSVMIVSGLIIIIVVTISANLRAKKSGKRVEQYDEKFLTGHVATINELRAYNNERRNE